jgi:hypothetical protein
MTTFGSGDGGKRLAHRQHAGSSSGVPPRTRFPLLLSSRPLTASSMRSFYFFFFFLHALPRPTALAARPQMHLPQPASPTRAVPALSYRALSWPDSVYFFFPLPSHAFCALHLAGVMRCHAMRECVCLAYIAAYPSGLGTNVSLPAWLANQRKALAPRVVNRTADGRRSLCVRAVGAPRCPKPERAARCRIRSLLPLSRSLLECGCQDECHAMPQRRRLQQIHHGAAFAGLWRLGHVSRGEAGSPTSAGWGLGSRRGCWSWNPSKTSTARNQSSSSGSCLPIRLRPGCAVANASCMSSPWKHRSLDGRVGGVLLALGDAMRRPDFPRQRFRLGEAIPAQARTNGGGGGSCILPLSPARRSLPFAGVADGPDGECRSLAAARPHHHVQAWERMAGLAAPRSVV